MMPYLMEQEVIQIGHTFTEEGVIAVDRLKT